MSISHPFVALSPSQSRKPSRHSPSHSPSVHRASMFSLEHSCPQPPQFAMSASKSKGEHVPSRRGKSQASHSPSQARSQQNPSRQFPSLHSSLLVHGSPRSYRQSVSSW